MFTPVGFLDEIRNPGWSLGSQGTIRDLTAIILRTGMCEDCYPYLVRVHTFRTGLEGGRVKPIVVKTYK